MIKGFERQKIEVTVTGRSITLRGVAVHNLKHIDLDIPHRKLVVLCGLSGSGKTSLALDTLYAEGQRRYIDSFSAYTRQFLERLEKPAADRIEGIPPAIAVTHRSTSRPVLSLWGRSTIGTATETLEHLRLLFAKIGQVHCLDCGQEVRRDTPQDAVETLQQLPAGTRYMISYAVGFSPKDNLEELAALLREDGFL
ncbi:MAG: excinuclease ABC subunit UvrA, partial [Planctomycetes bacterium]|nr:excinuclease ABC subunit UvrA [Planctomycetota bacterium]